MAFDVTKAFDVMKSLAQKAGGSGDISRADATKMFKKSDLDGDGIISLEEFKDFYMSTDDYESLEEEYLEAFEALSDIDGEEGLSEEDMNSAMEEAGELPAEVPSSGGGSGGGGGPTSKNPTTQNESDGNLDPVQLSEKYSESELGSKRSDAMNTLAEQREAKEKATEQAEQKVETTKEEYDNATKAFADKLAAKEEQLTELEENIVEIEETKEAVNTEVTAQKEAVSQCETTVSDNQSKVSDVQGQLDSLGDPPPETIPTYDEEGNEVGSAPNPAYEAYIAQKEALEAELAAAEDALAESEVELSEAEEKLGALEFELEFVESEFNKTVDNYMKTEAANNQELQTLKTNIDTANTEYSAAKTEKQTVTAPYETAIKAAQADLKSYDEAMKIEEMPQEWTKEEKLGLEKVDKADLPPTYEVKSDGKIYDKDGNVVGKTVMSEDEETGETKVESYYLEKQPEQESMYFIEMYEMVDKMLGEVEEGEFDPTKVWSSFDFSKMSSEDVAKVAEIYENRIAQEKEEAVDEAVKGLPDSFVDAAKLYLNNEQGSPEQFNEIVSSLVEESAENEKAAEMLNKEVDKALQSGDTSVIETMIATAESNYSEFMQYVSSSGLPSKIQSQMSDNSEQLLADLYSKVDQHSSNQASDYGIDEERAKELQENYITGNSNNDLRNVVELINSGTVSDPNEINYLLSQIGDSSEVMAAANKLMQNSEITSDDLNNIFTVSTTEYSQTMEQINSDPELAKYIEQKGIDPLKTDKSEIDNAIKDYEKEAKEAEKEEKEEFIKENLGASLEESFKDVKDDPEKMSTKVNSMLTDIQNSDLSPQEKLDLMKEIKNYSETASKAIEENLAKDDSFLVDTLNDMSKNPNEYSQEDKINFLKDYVGLEGAARIFDGNSSVNKEQTQAFTENIVKLFEESSDEQIKELQAYITPSTIASVISETSEGATETELLDRLMNCVANVDSDDAKLSTDPKDYGIDEKKAEEAKSKYLSGNDSENIKNILNAVDSGEISNDVAKYLLSEISDGNTENLMNEFRSGLSQEEQDVNLKQLFDVFAPPVETIPETKLPKLGSGNGSNKPAPTLEEFLASQTDPYAKKWFTDMFTKLGYDYDTFWDTSNIQRDFQSLYTEAFATGTIRSAGCGITCLSMLSEYLTGEYKAPNELTRGYIGDNPASALEKGLNATGVEWSRSAGANKMADLDASLAAGKPVIINVRSSSIFTEGGHFMVVTGKTEDGRYIVNDPNIENYLKPNMVDGFTNGFTREQIAQGLSHVIIFGDV